MKNIISDNLHLSNISNNDIMSSVLDPSRKFFLSPSCIGYKKTEDYVLGVLHEHKISSSDVYNEMDASLVNSGDYLIRCFGRIVQVWQIEVIPFGITTRFLENLGHTEND